MKNLTKLIVFTAVTIFGLATFAAAQSSTCGATDYQCKVDSLTKQLAANPGDSETYYNRAIAYHALGREDQAIADYTVYINSKPANKEYLADGYDGRGNAYKNQGNYTRALADYNTALQLHVSTVYLNNRGNCYMSMGNNTNAMADYDRAIALDPKDAEPYYNRAKLYSSQKLYSKAIADLNIYVELNKTNIPFLADGYQNRSLAYSNMGNNTQALKDISAAIDLDPNTASRFKNRSILYRKMGKIALAEADERSAAELAQ